MEFLTDHRYLNVENVKLLKSNDKVRWSFHTELNGLKDETVLFHGVIDHPRHSMWETVKSDKLETRIVPSLDVTYITPDHFGNTKWAHLREDEFFFRIWTNGYNPLKVISVNDKPWAEILENNCLNSKSELQQQYEHDIQVAERLISIATEIEVVKADYEHVFLLNDTSLIENMDVQEKVQISTTTAWGNIARTKAFLTTNKDYAIKKLPFQKSLQTVSVYVEKKRHDGEMYIFILPNQDIEGMKKELEKYVTETCVKKEAFRNGESYGFYNIIQ